VEKRSLQESLAANTAAMEEAVAARVRVNVDAMIRADACGTGTWLCGTGAPRRAMCRMSCTGVVSLHDVMCPSCLRSAADLQDRDAEMFRGRVSKLEREKADMEVACEQAAQAARTSNKRELEFVTASGRRSVDCCCCSLRRCPCVHDSWSSASVLVQCVSA
jgi:hypothetical protein